jgi:hypothetical protein
VKVGARVVRHAGKWCVHVCVGFSNGPVLWHPIRLSLSPVGVAERINQPWGRGVSEIASSAFRLRILLATLFAVGGFRDAEEVFQPKIHPNMQFECGSQKLMHYSG